MTAIKITSGIIKLIKLHKINIDNNIKSVKEIFFTVANSRNLTIFVNHNIPEIINKFIKKYLTNRDNIYLSIFPNIIFI